MSVTDYGHKPPPGWEDVPDPHLPRGAPKSQWTNVQDIMSKYPSTWNFWDSAGQSLAEELILELDKRMTSSRLRHKIILEWDRRLFHCRGSCQQKTPLRRIRLSAVRIHSGTQLWKTLSHEYCHVLNHVYANGSRHEAEFWKYGAMLNDRFPEHPPKILIPYHEDKEYSQSLVVFGVHRATYYILKNMTLRILVMRNVIMRSAGR